MDLTGLGSVADFAKGIMDRFLPSKMSEEEKTKAQLALEAVINERDQKLMEAQSSIIVAEMQQGDKFTKRARPWVVYGGLVFIGINYVLFPIMMSFIQIISIIWKVDLTGIVLPSLSLPGNFWVAWGGTVSIWSIGRSYERVNGPGNKMIDMITGGK